MGVGRVLTRGGPLGDPGGQDPPSNAHDHNTSFSYGEEALKVDLAEGAGMACSGSVYPYHFLCPCNPKLCVIFVFWSTQNAKSSVKPLRH